MGKETSVPFHLQWQTTLRRRIPVAKWLLLARTMFLVLRVLHLMDSVRQHRQTLFDKYAPTLYARLSPDQEAKLASRRLLWHDNQSHAERGGYSRDALMANRAEWQQLASGFEGEAFTYRNCVKLRPRCCYLRRAVLARGPTMEQTVQIRTSIVDGLSRQPASSLDPRLESGQGRSHALRRKMAAACRTWATS